MKKTKKDLSIVEVGVGILVVRDSQVLLGKRKNAHGSGEYAPAGGHLKYGESIKECALRELAEEMGPQMKVSNLKLVCLTNLKKYHPKHFIDIGLAAQWVSGQPLVIEPDKTESWGWFDLTSLPKPLFGSVEQYIKAYRADKISLIDYKE